MHPWLNHVHFRALSLSLGRMAAAVVVVLLVLVLLAVALVMRRGGLCLALRCAKSSSISEARWDAIARSCEIRARLEAAGQQCAYEC